MFVFDGATPMLKRATTAARRRRREYQGHRLKRTAEKILLSRLKKHALDEAVTAYQGDNANNELQPPAQEPVAPSPPSPSTRDVSGKRKQGYEADVVGFSSDDDGGNAGDGEFLLPEDVDSVDPTVLSTLPPSIQLEVMEKMREHKTVENREKFHKVSKAPGSFSHLQMNTYLQGCSFRRKMDGIKDQMNAVHCDGASGDGGGLAKGKRIASDHGREYILTETKVDGDLPSQSLMRPAPSALMNIPGQAKQGEQEKPREEGFLDIKVEAGVSKNEEGSSEDIFGSISDSESEVEWEDVEEVAPVPHREEEDQHQKVDKHWRVRASERQKFWSRTHGFQFGRKLGDWSDGSAKSGREIEQDELKKAIELSLAPKQVDDADADEELSNEDSDVRDLLDDAEQNLQGEGKDPGQGEVSEGNSTDKESAAPMENKKPSERNKISDGEPSVIKQGFQSVDKNLKDAPSDTRLRKASIFKGDAPEERNITSEIVEGASADRPKPELASDDVANSTSTPVAEESIANEPSLHPEPSSQNDPLPIYDEHFVNSDAMERELNAVNTEIETLTEQYKRNVRYSEEPTSEMYAECQELLKMCGIPYIIAPMEAEAQCAYLNKEGLVDGVITNDSDAFLFGANNIYRNIFENKKYVEEYDAENIAKDLGLSRENLIEMALLLGSDYTEGIHGVGIVNAMEIVNEFPGLEGLKEFKKWVRGIGTSSSAKKDISGDFASKHSSVKRNWDIPEGFPSEQVFLEYRCVWAHFIFSLGKLNRALYSSATRRWMHQRKHSSGGFQTWHC